MPQPSPRTLNFSRALTIAVWLPSGKVNTFNTSAITPYLYIPLGIGVKWMFAERWQLQAVWQHQIYVQNGDGLEGLPQLNNSHNLNGINIMNNDLVSSLTIGVVFEFWKKGDICVHCED